MTYNRFVHLFLAVVIAAGFVAACGDGSSGGDNGDGVQPVARLVFYTSTQGTADMSSWPEVSGSGLTGLEAADGICQARAEAAGYAGTFVAWLSDDNDDAYCRAHGLSGKKADNCGQAELPASAGPWFRTDGEPFSGDIGDLTDSGVIYKPVRANEFGSVHDVRYIYWTGTDDSGTAYQENCDNWTNGTGGPYDITLGATDGTVTLYTEGFVTTLCSQSNELLCMEIGTGNLVPAPDDTGKLVFVTSATGGGTLGNWALAGGKTGVLAGDNICQELASTAGLANPGNFKAWLSNSSENAVDRLASDGPWVRVDGVQVAASKSALVNSWLETSISVTENGEYVHAMVWTGTLEGGSKSSYVCSNWTAQTGVIGQYGQSGWAEDHFWTQTSTYSCSYLLGRLYCLED